MNPDGITVVIPTIAKRNDMLNRALASVIAQTLQPEGVIVVADTTRSGAAETRTRGLEMVMTKWVAFLDDDDTLMPVHLEHLLAHAEATEADFVFPWFEVMGGTDPFPVNEHKEWTLDSPHQTTVTTLVRTEAAMTVGGFRWGSDGDPNSPGVDADGHRAGEEFRFVVRLAQHGFKIEHLHERTWTWYHHWGNTSGMPSQT